MCQGFAGSNPLRFMKQYARLGLKFPVVTGETGGDDALLQRFGDEAIGLYSCCPYTLDLETDEQQALRRGDEEGLSTWSPASTAAGLYVNCEVVEAGLQRPAASPTTRQKFMAALKSVSLADTPRGPIKFDHLGNVVGDFYVRQLRESANGQALINKTVKTYENVSQFWTYDEKKFLAQPVYSRDYPPLEVLIGTNRRGRRTGARGFLDKREREDAAMTFWLVLTVNSITFGGLLFLLSAGFSLIFGLMRIPNLTHGSLFMLGAYFGATFVVGLLGMMFNFWVAALLAACAVAVFGALVERLLLRRLPGEQLAQVLVTLGMSFMVADFCLMVWGGDPISVTTPASLTGFCALGPLAFPLYRLADHRHRRRSSPSALWLLLDRTRLGAMIRAGVDDPDMARVVGIRVSQLFTIVFALGAGLAAFAGIIGGPILSVYPGLDQDMLPLALVVVILGGTGSLLGSFVGSIIIGFIYNFGQALLPELAYFVLFLPMLLVLLLRPQGLFGRHVP